MTDNNKRRRISLRGGVATKTTNPSVFSITKHISTRIVNYGDSACPDNDSLGELEEMAKREYEMEVHETHPKVCGSMELAVKIAEVVFMEATKRFDELRAKGDWEDENENEEDAEDEEDKEDEEERSEETSESQESEETGRDLDPSNFKVHPFLYAKTISYKVPVYPGDYNSDDFHDVKASVRVVISKMEVVS